MRRRWFLVLAVSVSTVVACSRAKEAEVSSPKAPPAKRVLPLGPEAKMGTNKIDETKVRLDLTQLRAAIRAYKIEHADTNPPHIRELGVTLFFPADIAYDQTTGTVRSGTYPQY